MLDTSTSDAHDAIARAQREPKYWGLKRHLLEVLSSLPPGSPIPTERSLAAQFDALELALRAVRQLGIRTATVPGDFPLALADRLREQGVTLVCDDAFFDRRRRVKTEHELAGIRRACPRSITGGCAVSVAAPTASTATITRGRARCTASTWLRGRRPPPPPPPPVAAPSSSTIPARSPCPLGCSRYGCF